jgi:glucose/arabinose dehydrogenase
MAITTYEGFSAAMMRRPALIIVLIVILGLLLPTESLAQFSDLPQGFNDDPVAEDLGRPTAFDWLPNGDLLIAAQHGTLFRQSGDDPAVPILDLDVGPNGICSFDDANEMGLLGLAVDPDFGNEPGHIFLYYTDRKADGRCANRVSRFTIDDGGSLGNERVLIDNIPAPGGNHNGGDLQFDRNDLLYISVGDGGQDLRDPARTQEDNGNARRLDILNGKILRIQRNGGIPSGNPFTGSGTRRCSGAPVLDGESAGAKAENKKKDRRKKKKKRRRQRRNRSGPVCQEIFATGLRNPFRIAFDPNDNNGPQRFFINDVGTSAWEEIDEGQAGADYGWNVREGPCSVGSISNCQPDNRFEEPRFAYRLQQQKEPFDGCRTITGGAFVPDEAEWASFNGVYLFADFRCGKIFILSDEDPGDPTGVFASGLPLFQGATHLAIGPAPEFALYYTTFDGGGQVRKLVPPQD